MLQKTSDFTHINLDALVESKVPILSGRGSENNEEILRIISLNGSMLKYDIQKHIPTVIYSTISRRVDDLTRREYLGESGRRRTERGRQSEESMYGLTWKGFIASITIKEVRKNFLEVLKKNPLLAFPEKESILTILEELVTKQELETISMTILEAFLKTIPNLDLVENELMSIFAWMLSIREKIELPKGFKLSRMPKDIWELLKILDKPAILQAVKRNIIPLIVGKTKEIKTMYQLLSVLSVVGEYISGLEVENQPSKKIREFIETKLESNLLELKKQDIWREE